MKPKKEQSNMWKRMPRLFGIGIAMGSADIIPGVSGGTMAFIFGIYQELLYSIKITTSDALKKILKGNIKEGFWMIPFSFLIPLGTGIFMAILLLSKILSWLLKEYPSHVWGFFFGLVLVSIFIVLKRIKKWQTNHTIGFVITACITYVVVGALPVETAATLPLFFLSGIIAISAMILPGISGSFILLILGKYHQILEALNNRDILVLLVFMIGCVIGIALFSRILTWLFERYHDIAVSLLAGVMGGSLRKLWPWKETVMTRINSHGEHVPFVEHNIIPSEVNSSVFFIIILIMLGGALMYYLTSIQLIKEKRIQEVQ